MPAELQRRMTPTAAVTLVVICLIFGANAVAIKISMTGLGPFTAAAIRFAIGAVAIYAWARTSGRSFVIRRQDMPPLLILCALVTIQLSLFYLGLSKTLASRGVLIINVVPFLVLIFAHFFIPGDRMTMRKIIGMLFGFSGVALVMSDTSTLAGGWRSGDAIILIAATCWAGGAVYTKRIIHRYDPFQLVLYPIVLAVPIQFLEGMLWDAAMIVHIDLKIVLAVLYSALACTAVGLVTWNTMLNRFGASVLHTFVFIIPVAGVVAGGVILKEPITLRLLLAAALVAVGIGVVNIRSGTAIVSTTVGRNV